MRISKEDRDQVRMPAGSRSCQYKHLCGVKPVSDKASELRMEKNKRMLDGQRANSVQLRSRKKRTIEFDFMAPDHVMSGTDRD